MAEILFIRKRKDQGNPNLVGRYWPPGVVPHDSGYNPSDPGAGVSAPDEVEAGLLNEELVLAGRNRRGDVRLGIVDVLVGGVRREPGPDRAIDAEDEKDEEERGEELEERRSLVPPRQDCVLLKQRPVLLRHETSSAQQLHQWLSWTSLLAVISMRTSRDLEQGLRV